MTPVHIDEQIGRHIGMTGHAGGQTDRQADTQEQHTDGLNIIIAEGHCFDCISNQYIIPVNAIIITQHEKSSYKMQHNTNMLRPYRKPYSDKFCNGRNALARETHTKAGVRLPLNRYTHDEIDEGLL